MKKFLVLLLILTSVMALSLTGCKTSSDSEPAKTVDLVVANNSTKAVTAVYLDAYSTDVNASLGSNQISTSIAPNGRAHIALAAGDYSFRISFEGMKSGYVESWHASDGTQIKFSFKENAMPTIWLADSLFSDGSYAMKISSYDAGDK
jgi:hypothetical protein